MFLRRETAPAAQAPQRTEAAPAGHRPPAAPSAPVVDAPGFRDLKQEVHARLVDELDASLFVAPTLPPEAHEQLRNLLMETVQRRQELISRSQLEVVFEELLAEIKGLGPLEPLLNDPAVSEIMVNHARQVYVERAGRLTLSSVRFLDDRHLLRIIDRIVSRVGRHIDEATPMCDARLPDGSRVNAIIPPLALKGPCLTIRRFGADPLKIDDLLRIGSMTEAMAMFLKHCVEAKLNVLVSGGTGSGKTTMLNALSAFIPDNERLVTIEDAAELQLQQPHVISLETRQANVEGQGLVTQADLLRNCLRMRPDRIIIGEVRGGEALSMLQAMNTGHEGSLATIHANTCRDALSRLETMVLMAGMDLPHRAIRDQIGAAIHVIVQIERSHDGRRRVSQISELVGMEGDIYLLQDIFSFEVTGRGLDGELLGAHKPSGIVPRMQTRMADRGLALPVSLFQAGGAA